MHVEGRNFQETSDFIQSLREVRRKFHKKNIVEKRARDDTLLDRVHSVLGSGNGHNVLMDKKSIRSLNRQSSNRSIGYRRSISVESGGGSTRTINSQFPGNLSNRSSDASKFTFPKKKLLPQDPKGGIMKSRFGSVANQSVGDEASEVGPSWQEELQPKIVILDEPEIILIGHTVAVGDAEKVEPEEDGLVFKFLEGTVVKVLIAVCTLYA